MPRAEKVNNLVLRIFEGDAGAPHDWALKTTRTKTKENSIPNRCELAWHYIKNQMVKWIFQARTSPRARLALHLTKLLGVHKDRGGWLDSWNRLVGLLQLTDRHDIANHRNLT